MATDAIIIIPCRYNSSRLPGKPLLKQTGKTLIQHVYENASLSELATKVIVATDNIEIFDAVQSFGGTVVFTSPSHQTGTERVAEAANAFPESVIVNVQGDEPEIAPSHIDMLIDTQIKSNAFMSTLVCPFPKDKPEGPGSPMDPACVKVTFSNMRPDGTSTAYYFSRSIIPAIRPIDNHPTYPVGWFMHVGIYAYTSTSLREFSALSPGPLESTEQLEQLRAIENGKDIALTVIPQSSPGIDTPEDYSQFVERLKKKRGVESELN